MYYEVLNRVTDNGRAESPIRVPLNFLNTTPCGQNPLSKSEEKFRTNWKFKARLQHHARLELSLLLHYSTIHPITPDPLGFHGVVDSEGELSGTRNSHIIFPSRYSRCGCRTELLN